VWTLRRRSSSRIVVAGQVLRLGLAPLFPRRADTMAVQEDHDFPYRLLLGPGGKDAGSANRPDAIDLAQSVRGRLDDVEYLLAEGAHEFLRVNRANARIMPDERYFSMPWAEVGG
jgi:hypothetical protein